MAESDAVLAIASEILGRQGKSAKLRPDTLLRDVGFRSLDFAELALRVEKAQGRPLRFDAASLRRIESFRDVQVFFENA